LLVVPVGWTVAKLMYAQVGKCSYFDRVRRQFTRSNMDLHGIPSTWDLEDIVSFGQQIRVSYFFIPVMCLPAGLSCCLGKVVGRTSIVLENLLLYM